MAQVFAHPVNLTDFLKQVQYINSLTDVGFGGALGIIIEAIVFFSIFLLTKAYTYERSFATSMIVTSFIAVLLRIWGLLNDTILTLTLIVLVISFYFLWKESDGF